MNMNTGGARAHGLYASSNRDHPTKTRRPARATIDVLSLPRLSRCHADFPASRRRRPSPERTKPRRTVTLARPNSAGIVAGNCRVRLRNADEAIVADVLRSALNPRTS